MANTSLTLTLNELLEAEKNAKKIIERAEKKKQEILSSIPTEIEFIRKKYKDELAKEKSKIEKEFLSEIKKERSKMEKKIKEETSKISSTKVSKVLVDSLLEELLRF